MTEDARPTVSETALDALALRLTNTAGRFSHIAGRNAAGGYSLVAWRVLAELESKGPLSSSDLAKSHRVSQPAMSGLIARFSKENWVSRVPDPHDGRSHRVVLEPAGLRALEAYRKGAADRVRPHLEQLTEFDRAVLGRAIELLNEVSESIDDPRG